MISRTIEALEETIMNRIIDEYFISLLHGLLIENKEVINRRDYPLIYDNINGAKIRIRLNEKLKEVSPFTIIHEHKKFLWIKSDIFKIQ